MEVLKVTQDNVQKKFYKNDIDIDIRRKWKPNEVILEMFKCFQLLKEYTEDSNVLNQAL